MVPFIWPMNKLEFIVTIGQTRDKKDPKICKKIQQTFQVALMSFTL